MAGTTPTDSWTLKEHSPRPSILGYGGGLLRRLIPRRRSNRTPDAVEINSSRPRLTIPSLAVATLTGLAQTQQMPPLAEAASSSLMSMLSLWRSGKRPASSQGPDQQQPAERSASGAAILHSVSDHQINHFEFLDIAPGILVSDPTPTPFNPQQPSRATHSTTSQPEDVRAVDPSAESTLLDVGRIAFTSPRAEPNASSPPLHETNTVINLIPHMRPLRRLSVHSGTVSGSLVHNRRLALNPLNQSSSSLATIASSYVTARTGTPPSPSIRSVHSEMPRCDSPIPIFDARRVRVQSFQASSLRESVVMSELYEPLDSLLDAHPTPKTPSSTLSVPSTPSSPSRKILIMGSSYQGRDEVKRMFSIETLDGVLEDKEQIRMVFTERSYSVQTLFEEEFDRERALTKVAEFLGDAKSGDVRAIVFTGHGHAHDDGTVWLVPPGCPSKNKAISRTDWDQNIQDHTPPGVVVFSIMAHCHSGKVMKQKFDHSVWEAPEQISNIEKGEPLYLTFAASDEGAFESWVTRSPHPPRTGDHFIHALVGAIRSIDVATGTWGEFFAAFDRHFKRARSCASWHEQVASGKPGWRSNNVQMPRFTASGFIRLSVVF
ncbi:hypothetical protein FRC11_008800 [Ceratobasidium sp. 423]|nr:hypothetical protein FRC11_008800 [Ceratobasidium sp. 423]